MSDRISRLLLPGGDEPFEYETRKRGVGIVPEVSAKKSKLEGKETKKVGLGIETKFGDLSGSSSKSAMTRSKAESISVYSGGLCQG